MNSSSDKAERSVNRRPSIATSYHDGRGGEGDRRGEGRGAGPLARSRLPQNHLHGLGSNLISTGRSVPTGFTASFSHPSKKPRLPRYSYSTVKCEGSSGSGRPA